MEKLIGGRKTNITIKRGEYPLVAVTTPLEFQPVIVFADLHVGVPTLDERTLDRTILYAKKKKAICLGAGDWIENANRNSVGAGWAEQVMVPKEQERLIIEKFEIIKDQFIGAIRGNHEDRTWKDAGHDPMDTICNMLDIPYFGEELCAIVSRKNGNGNTTRSYSIYINHSGTTNKTTGLAFNWIEREAENWIGADIICKAHGHDMGMIPVEYLSVDKSHLYADTRLRWFWCPGHFMGRPSYLKKKMKRPKPTGTPVAILDMRQHHLRVEEKKIVNEKWGSTNE